MPRLSAWFIRCSLIYLVIGFTLGGLMLFNKAIPLSPFVWRLLPSHIEFVIFGWTLQLILGMGFWILPRFSTKPVRGNENIAWVAFALVNVGIWLVVLASIYPVYGWFNLAGRAAEAGAVLTFTANVWPRIKGV